MENKKKNPIASIALTIVCILWMYPIVLILINALKKEAAITTSGVFSLPTSETWNGFANFVASVTEMDFLKSFWYSLVISVMSVVLIMLCCSMVASRCFLTLFCTVPDIPIIQIYLPVIHRRFWMPDQWRQVCILPVSVVLRYADCLLFRSPDLLESSLPPVS